MNRQLIFICAIVLIVVPLPFVGVPHGLEFIIYEIIGLVLLYQALRKPRAHHDTSKTI